MSYVTDSFDERVIELLKQGGVGLLPTDTMYGLSCRALDRDAVGRIYSLKDRDQAKPFIILISDVEILNMLSISTNQAKTVQKYWPSALSVIFEAPSAPAWLHRSTHALAMRLPDNSGLRDLISKVGPIISTSANLRDREPIHTAGETKAIFDDKLDFYVDAGELNNPPSTLAELKDGKLNVVRQGAVTIDEKERL